MAEIFLAHREGLVTSSDKVVVKRIRSDRANDPAHVDLFLNEARIAAHFRHPNLVPVRELVRDHGQLAMVMDFVDGYSIKELIERCREYARYVPFEIAAYIIAEAAEGLHYAHELRNEAGDSFNIVHRDISPTNIIVTREGGVRLLDFGVAASDLPLREEQGVVRGKFSYMAPETVLNQPFDRRADVFALGVVFYELLTLQPCFTRNDPVDTLDAIINGRLRPARESRASLPAELEALLEHMLARRPDDRIATAADVSILLWQYLVAHAPVMADDIQCFFADLFHEVELPEIERSPHERDTVEIDSHWLLDYATTIESTFEPLADEDTLIELTDDDLVPNTPRPTDVHDIIAAVELPMSEERDTPWDEPEELEEEWSVTDGQGLRVPEPSPIEDNETWWVHESGASKPPLDFRD